MIPCLNCGKMNHGMNYCDWACGVEAAKKAGGVIHTPNGLPIRCVRADNTMLEHEHGDHPDYKFPIDVEVLDPELNQEYAKDFLLCGQEIPEGYRHIEEQALIYQDGSIALTLYECCYSMWSLYDGVCLGGFNEAKRWRITEESMAKIRGLGTVSPAV